MGFFRDDNGQKSMGRLKVFIALVAAVTLAFLLVLLEAYFCAISTIDNPKDFNEAPGATIVASLLAYAGAVKIFQKKEEVKKILSS